MHERVRIGRIALVIRADDDPVFNAEIIAGSGFKIGSIDNDAVNRKSEFRFTANIACKKL